MRILITHPFALDQGPAAGPLRRLAAALAGAGHAVRVLVLDRSAPAAAGPLDAVAVTCRPGDPAADLDFAVPVFETVGTAGPSFASLSADQLARYREAIRQVLDRQVDAFDPHLIHVEYVWLLGQLVLETGVPYVARLWGPELTSCLDQVRIRELVQQTAENSSRILVADEAQAAAASAAFDVGRDRIVVLPPDRPLVEPLVALTRTVLAERFGSPPPD